MPKFYNTRSTRVKRYDDNGKDKHFENLTSTLKDMSENVLFLSIGGTHVNRRGTPDFAEQILPTYLKNLAKKTSVRALLINPVYADFAHLAKYDLSEGVGENQFKEMLNLDRISEADDKRLLFQPKDKSLDLTLEVFPCFIGDEGQSRPKDKILYSILTKQILNILDKGGKVFIGIHSQYWNLHDTPYVGQIYNFVKRNHPEALTSLQLYVQCAYGIVRYFAHRLYDEKKCLHNYQPKRSDEPYVSGVGKEEDGPDPVYRIRRCNHAADLRPVGDEFSICETIKGLADLSEFIISSRPIPARYFS